MARRLLVSPCEWRAARYAKGSGPTTETITRWVKAGNLEGERIAGRWYPYEDAEHTNLKKATRPGMLVDMFVQRK